MTVQPTSHGGLHVDVPDVPAGVFAPVYGKMSTGTNQAVADLANDVLVLFDTLAYESEASVVDLVNDRFVAPVAGIYLVTSIIHWVQALALPVDSSFSLVVQVNALVNATARQTIQVASGGSTPGSNVLATAIECAAGDLVTLRVAQVSQAERTLDRAEATFQRVG
jgi:hypothetical protein